MEIGGAEMSNLECPVCGSSNIQTEKRPDGFHHCMNCRYSWEIGAKQLKQTLFETITTSPEVLAPKLVYCVPFVTVGGKGFDRWYSTLEPFDKDIYYYTKEKAVAVTVAKLKESYAAQPATN